MALILNIETASNICSVALARNGEIISIQENKESQSHARVLTTLISDCFSKSGNSLKNLDAVAVSMGPGSYTGLRIGVSTAKGLCYALGIPLISVNTLQSMANAFQKQHKTNISELLCPMIDARRMEVYTAIFDHKLEFRVPTSALIIDSSLFGEILQSQPVIFFGDGMQKAQQIINNQTNAIFASGFELSASGMVEFSENSYKTASFESIEKFEPFYLKEFYSPRQLS